MLQRVQQNHLTPSFFRFGGQDIHEAFGRCVEHGAVQSRLCLDVLAGVLDRALTLVAVGFSTGRQFYQARKDK
jgi:hypothetical protein